MATLPDTIRAVSSVAKDTIDKLDAQPSLDPQMKEAIAKLRPIILRAAEGLNSPEWAHFVKTVTSIVTGFSNIPAEFRDKIVGTIESSFFAAAYPRHHCLSHRQARRCDHGRFHSGLTPARDWCA